jgi:hypothetical protein
MTQPTRIRRLEDVRPGDLFLGPIGGLAGVAVRAGQLAVDGGWRVGPLDVRHIGVVVQASTRYDGPVIQDRKTGQVERVGDALAYVPDGWDLFPTGLITCPRMVQAMPSGANEIDLKLDRHWTPRCAFARIPEDYPGQAEDAAAIARAMIGIPYSWASYAALSAYRLGYKAPRLTGWIGRRQPMREIPGLYANRAVGTERLDFGRQLPVEAICSVLADQAWSLAGKRVMVGTAPQAVTPSQLGQRLLFGMEGVVWGFGATDPRAKDWPVL